MIVSTAAWPREAKPRGRRGGFEMKVRVFILRWDDSAGKFGDREF